MAKGRPRKPTDIIKLEEGKYYPCQHQDRDGEPIAKGLPVKPKGLPKLASENWDFIVPHLVGMGVAKEADTEALEEMCRLHALKARFHKEIFHKGKDGSFNKYLNASKQWLQLASRFGMTPADRARIDIRTNEEKKNPTKRHLA